MLVTPALLLLLLLDLALAGPSQVLSDPAALAQATFAALPLKAMQAKQAPKVSWHYFARFALDSRSVLQARPRQHPAHLRTQSGPLSAVSPDQAPRPF
jgi:hypothetical protein